MKTFHVPKYWHKFEDRFNTGTLDFASDYYNSPSVYFNTRYGMKAENITKEIDFEGHTLMNGTIKLYLDCDNRILEYWIEKKKAYTVKLLKKSFSKTFGLLF